MPFKDPIKRAQYGKDYQAKLRFAKKYGNVPKEKDSGDDAVQELPVSVSGNAGGFPIYQDELIDLDAAAYTINRQSPCVYMPMQKVGQLLSKREVVVVGNGSRQSIYQEIIDNMYGLKDAIRDMVWGFPEGMIFCHIKVGMSNDSLTGPYVLPDLRGGVRKKSNAGGFLRWDGERVVREQRSTGVAVADGTDTLPKELNRKDFIVFHPGASGNPEGNMELGINLYKCARSWNRATKNLDLFSDRFGLPVERLRQGGQMTAAASATVLLAKSTVLSGRLPGQPISLTMRDELELLEPKGTGAEIMLMLRRDSESMASRLILQNDLTSTTANSGPSGSSMVQEGQQSDGLESWADSLMCAFTEDLLAWIAENNPDMPPDETMYYLELVEQTQEMDVDDNPHLDQDNQFLDMMESDPEEAPIEETANAEALPGA